MKTKIKFLFTILTLGILSQSFVNSQAVNGDTLIIPHEEGIYSFDIDTSENWAQAKNVKHQDYIRFAHPKLVGNQIQFDALENPKTSSRIEQIHLITLDEFWGHPETDTIYLKQEGKPAVLYFEQFVDDTADYNQTKSAFAVYSNLTGGNWNFKSSEDWLTLEKSGWNMLNLSYEKNPSREPREAKVIIYYQGVSDTAVFYQKADPLTEEERLQKENEKLLKLLEGMDDHLKEIFMKFLIPNSESNSAEEDSEKTELETPEETLSETEAEEKAYEDTATLVEQRPEIPLKSLGVDLDSISLSNSTTEEEPYIEISEQLVNVPAEAGEKVIVVNSNVDYEIENPPVFSPFKHPHTWAERVENTGFVKIHYGENGSLEERKTLIYFHYLDITQAIYVIQEGGKPYFEFYPDDEIRTDYTRKEIESSLFSNVPDDDEIISVKLPEGDPLWARVTFRQGNKIYIAIGQNETGKERVAKVFATAEYAEDTTWLIITQRPRSKPDLLPRYHDSNITEDKIELSGQIWNWGSTPVFFCFLNPLHRRAGKSIRNRKRWNTFSWSEQIIKFRGI